MIPIYFLNMEKKTLFLEMPCDLVDKIDRMNTLGDRSAFVTNLLQKQFEQRTSTAIEPNTELATTMKRLGENLGLPGEIGLVDNVGSPLGRFDINTVEGFEKLAKKIEEVSEDPVVRIRARRLL